MTESTAKQLVRLANQKKNEKISKTANKNPTDRHHKNQSIWNQLDVVEVQLNFDLYVRGAMKNRRQLKIPWEKDQVKKRKNKEGNNQRQRHVIKGQSDSTTRLLEITKFVLAQMHCQ